MREDAASERRGRRVLCIGETMALVVPARAESAETAEEFLVDVGGAESNVAAHLAGAGHHAVWFSALGDDALGRRTRARIAQHGVDTSTVLVDRHAPTGLYVKDPGNGVSYYRRGSAASRLRPDDLEAIEWDEVGLLHLSGITLALSESCRALVHAAIDSARARGVLVSFDVNHRPPLWPSRQAAADAIREAADRADIVFVGRDEAEALWSTTRAQDVRGILPRVPHLVVKDADIEATEFSGDDRVAVRAHRVDVVEPVGAGDAFAAGWLDAYLRGLDAGSRLATGHGSAARALSSTSDVPVADIGSITPS